MKKNITHSLLLLLAAFIWGVAFVAQSTGMDYLGGFSFNCIRSFIGGIALLPIVFVTSRSKRNTQETKKEGHKGIGTLLVGGLCCGTALCIASNLQQFGLKYTSVGKAGFITALYIVLVPIFGLFFHKKVGKALIVGLLFAVVGLYCLCMTESLTIGRGDFLVILCAIVFACHILVIDYFAPKVNPIALSCVQFWVSGILTAIPMFMFETLRWQDIVGAAIPLLYTGVMSSGVAYTLQIIGQRDMNPTVASMVMSMESVFSVLAGLIILQQHLSSREILGCVLVFIAVILAQLPDKNKLPDRQESN